MNMCYKFSSNHLLIVHLKLHLGKKMIDKILIFIINNYINDFVTKKT